MTQENNLAYGQKYPGYYLSRLGILLSGYNIARKESLVQDQMTYRVISNPETGNYYNPPSKRIMWEVEGTLNYLNDGTSGKDLKNPDNWKTLPWSGQEIDPLELLLANMTFKSGSDERYKDYFPVAETRQLRESVVKVSDFLKRPLTASEIYDLSLKNILNRYNGVYPLAAAIEAHSTTRLMARNQVKLVDQVSPNEIQDWSSNRVARFDVSGKPNSAGGMYHFFGSMTSGMVYAIKWRSDELGIPRILSPKLNGAAPVVEEYIARINSLMTGKPRDFNHRTINWNAVKIGYNLSREYLG